ncbi:MAG TPA: DUF5060 domain-containing protein [Verrucomicrobiae bacterium]|nr:DUF5060 domain-containing protein [Verrucomicrobiae bacterium]
MSLKKTLGAPISRRAVLAAALAQGVRLRGQGGAPRVERWGLYDVNLGGPRDGNPFVEVRVSAQFRHEHRAVEVDGFYDGNGSYKVRFSPDVEGEWSYTTRSNRRELDGKTGSLVCTAPSAENHGPVSVRNTFHFGYADGQPYFPFGTTCYAWTHQPDELQQQTVNTLRDAPFNKMRMCIFPKWYEYNRGEPRLFPFLRSGGVNDYTRFDPEFWRNLESRIAQLQELGIEADLILFHPYDHWGYALMPPEVDERYLRYVVARLAAYRSVWWSVANEWDLVKGKKAADWDGYFRILQQADPYSRLRSIHHSRVMYDHGKAWVTHASIQGDEFQKTPEWRDTWRKPVVFDECKYEGNIPQRWGDISAQELTRRFWLGTVYGAYVGHGETYLDAKEILWWSKGGVLHGESPKRIAFLRGIVENGPPDGLAPLANPYYPGAAKAGEYYLFYLDYHQPEIARFDLPADARFEADVIDPWAMTITRIPGTHSGRTELKMPGRPYLAARFRRAG